MVGTRPAKTRPDTAVGQLLTVARQQRGLRLREVAAELKIPVAQLRGLEQGDLSVFPAEVYARGAFVTYAQYLGVRAERTERAFSRLLSGAREYVPLRVHTPRPWLAAMLTPRWVVAGMVAALAVVVGSYVAWQVTTFVRLPALSLAAPTGVVEASPVVVSGEAALDAQVMVNGEQVLVAEDGSFVTELSLHPGVNVVQVAATNAAGRTRVITREVLLPRS